MRGLYYETISRRDGKTKFLIQPLETSAHARDGLIMCFGEISVYQGRMPLELEGDFDSGGIFQVESVNIADPVICNGKSHFLDYLCPRLTPRQKSKLTGKVMHINRQMLKKAGVSDAITDVFIKARDKYSDQQSLIQFLEDCGIEGDDIENLLKKNVHLSSFLHNPYKACLYHGMSIYNADRIASVKLKIAPYATMRICGFIEDAIRLLENSGDTCSEPEKLLNIVNARLRYSCIQDTGITMAILNCCIGYTQLQTEIVGGKVFYSSKTALEEEQSVVKHLARLQSGKFIRDSVPDISQIELEMGITYTKSQKHAFEAIRTSGVKVLTGPPGSGKTAIIRGMVENSKNVKLAATTGRASQVLSKATGKDALTVHKLLDIRPYGESLCSKNINNPIDADLIVVDEASMMGLSLASRLFQAVKTGATLLLVGDEDQLQSVEYGSVLSDLIGSGALEVYRLDQVIRQQGTIRKNAGRICKGNTEMDEDDTFRILEFNDNKTTLLALLDNVNDKSHVLTTVKQKELGTRNLNSIIQKKDTAYCLSYGETDYYEGDPIIMCRTDYDKGYFNGETGRVMRRQGNGLLISFREKEIRMDREDLAFMQLAYAVTIHKSQGDEFSDVHIVLPDYAPGMLTRRLIYTAVTRATKTVTVYSVNHSFRSAILNTHEKKRMTNLGKRIIIEQMFD